MSPLEIELAYRAALLAEPTPQPSPYLLDSLIRALPRPPAGAPVAWRYAYLQRVIEELCAFAPFNAMEAALASPSLGFRIMLRKRSTRIRESTQTILSVSASAICSSSARTAAVITPPRRVSA